MFCSMKSPLNLITLHILMNITVYLILKMESLCVILYEKLYVYEFKINSTYELYKFIK